MKTLHRKESLKSMSMEVKEKKLDTLSEKKVLNLF